MIYITKPDARIAYHAKSLTSFASKYQYKDGIEFWVFKSLTAFREGFEYTVYHTKNGKLVKSKTQPAVAFNRWVSGLME